MNHHTRLVLASILFASTATSALAALPPCAQPTGGPAPRASDALYVLKAAVSQGPCDIRVCDPSDTNTVTASDALMILRAAVGQDVYLNCPG
jgi:hypothetical protein